MTTRFASWGAGPARALLIGVAAAILYAVASVSTPIPESEFLSGDPMRTDTALYKAVIDRVAAGQGYYDAVVAEHRARAYPLRPFVTVRPPTLAVVEARIGLPAAGVLLQVLAFGTVMALGIALKRGVAHPILVPTIAAAFSITPLSDPGLVIWHEVWAGLLMALSLSLRAPGRWAASLAVGVAAVAVRELALPYLLAMAWLAYWDGRRGEAFAWLAGVGLVAAGLAAHAAAVAARVLPDDLASPGWASFGGVRLVATMIHATGVLDVVSLPLWAAGVALPLLLLGWWSDREPARVRGALVVTGFVGAFMFVGRTNNIYWGFLLAPIVLIGLATAPAALRDLWRAARLPALGRDAGYPALTPPR